MRRLSFPVLLVLSVLLPGCNLGVEKGLGSWDCNRPHWVGLTIFPTRMILQTDGGTLEASGQWKDNGFWCSSSAGEYEAAHVVSEDQLTLQARAFVPGDSATVACYKTAPGFDEAQQMAEQNKGPVTYPPPKGAITIGMSEYRLNMLPWKTTSISQDNDNHMPEVYTFPSNDPNKPPLTVSVQNHQVISVSGGNE